ncbi:hypothetical protein [Methylobacterium sp. yr596]|uniref:hypothetical protein n=1 Tax=Methylobacterium sp. yr596 TaxID=1761800 RepID=UPI0011144E9B|nr:hypothetical protein [Methylobacterium sp. yr596]
MKHNPEGYAAVLAVVRSAWALVDNTAYHDWLPLTVSRDDWNDLVADLNRLKAFIPPDELPAEPPHAVTCLLFGRPSTPNDEAGFKPASRPSTSNDE